MSLNYYKPEMVVKGPYEGREITSGRVMRRLCGRWVPVRQVYVWSTPGRHGFTTGMLQVLFDHPDHFELVREEWQCVRTLAEALRNWRNLCGAPLVVDGLPAGKVSRDNEVLKHISNS